ncbi:MAG: hypothetical protein NT092_13745 [Bacteroidia bacterium]|nr:hypothetical protein [Bacteroidia bacterium]
MFPLSVKYSVKLKKKVLDSDVERIMKSIKEDIEEKSGEEIVIEGSTLTYKSRFGGIRMSYNILKTVEKGIFQLNFDGTMYKLTYEFFMYRIFLLAFISSIVFGIITKKALDGLIFFVVLGLFNWLITIIRHRMMFRDMVSDIEDIILERKRNP